MRKSQSRLQADINSISLPSYLEICRDGKTNVFVRNRKITVKDLVFSMINRRGLTLHMELRNYMKIAHPEVTVSKVAYLKQRMKLNPAAIITDANFASSPAMTKSGTLKARALQFAFSLKKPLLSMICTRFIPLCLQIIETKLHL